jgi:hypothetical protein
MQHTNLPQFVAQYAPLYLSFVTELKELQYTRHIRRNAGRPFAPEEVVELFRWKAIDRFFPSQRPHVEKNFVAYREAAHALRADITAREFLVKFPNGGRIWRIAWLHFCYPDRFPIYDMHVHRAMTVMLDGQMDELAKYRDDDDVVNLYVERYCPFYERFGNEGIVGRDVDRALWVFGKLVKAGKVASNNWQRSP